MLVWCNALEFKRPLTINEQVQEGRNGTYGSERTMGIKVQRSVQVSAYIVTLHISAGAFFFSFFIAKYRHHRLQLL
jgi:hypothetical protein